MSPVYVSIFYSYVILRDVRIERSEAITVIVDVREGSRYNKNYITKLLPNPLLIKMELSGVRY